MTDPIEAMLGPLEGTRIVGDCDYCDAYQVPRKVATRVWVLCVHHDDDCPFLARIEARQ